MTVNEKINISTFIKFGEEVHIRDLYENGTIYCRSMDIFKVIEDNDLRGDSWEGKELVRTFTDSDKVKLEISKGNNVIANLTPTFAQVSKDRTVAGGNLYCLYTIKPTDVAIKRRFKMDIKNKDFGTHFVVIKNNQAFIERIFAALVKGNYKYQCGLVEYIDDKKNSPFQKRRRFAYQNEFRILIENTTTNPIVLNIGSIKDIAMVLELEDLEKFSFKAIKISP